MNPEERAQIDNSPHGSSAITTALNAMSRGDATAVNQIFGLIYAELRRIADREICSAGADGALQPTVLVHEVFLRLRLTDAAWESRRHFYGTAARAMQRLLLDDAKHRRAVKRGGGKPVPSLEGDDIEGATAHNPIDWLALADAITELERHDGRAAEVVRLKFFAGLTFEEISRILEISDRTAKRDWEFSRAWLRRRMRGDHDPAPPEDAR
jgi:RNA polymerase sigma-70 factor, ECF subfamily